MESLIVAAGAGDIPSMLQLASIYSQTDGDTNKLELSREQMISVIMAATPIEMVSEGSKMMEPMNDVEVKFVFDKGDHSADPRSAEALRVAQLASRATKAKNYLQLASDLNDPEAKFQLGDLLWNEDKDNFAQEINTLWVDSANMGNVDAMFRLGFQDMMRRGASDLLDFGHDSTSWMMRAAENGHAFAQHQIGSMCMMRIPTSNAHHLEAKEWFLKSQKSTLGKDYKSANEMSSKSLQAYKPIFEIYKNTPNWNDKMMEEKKINRTTCHHCRKLKTEEHKLKICKCHQVRYCNTDCQKADWANHRSMCKQWQKIMLDVDKM